MSTQRSGEHKGVLDTLKEKLGLSGEQDVEKDAHMHVKEQMESHGAPQTPGRGGEMGKPTTDLWRTAEAETVRAEKAATEVRAVHEDVARAAAEARRATEVGAQASAKVQAARGSALSAAETQQAREAETARLEAQLAEAKRRAKLAVERREECEERARRLSAPAKDLRSEAKRLEKEAEAAQAHAREIKKSLGGMEQGPGAREEMREKSQQAEALRGEAAHLGGQAGREEEQARAMQAEAEEAFEKARQAVHRADELAIEYWKRRDEAKAMEAKAKELATSATAAARAAQKHRKDVQDREGAAGKARTEAELAQQRLSEEAENKRRLQEHKSVQEARAGDLAATAAARRASADQAEQEAEKLRERARMAAEDADRDCSGLKERMGEARREAEAAAADQERAAQEVTRLEAVVHEAKRAGRERLQAMHAAEERVEALKGRQQEHWERAKAHGDAAREATVGGLEGATRQMQGMAMAGSEGRVQSHEGGMSWESHGERTTAMMGGNQTTGQSTQTTGQSTQTTGTQALPTRTLAGPLERGDKSQQHQGVMGGLTSGVSAAVSKVMGLGGDSATEGLELPGEGDGTDEARTAPVPPHSTRAGGVDLPVHDDPQQHLREAVHKQATTVAEEPGQFMGEQRAGAKTSRGQGI